MTPLGQRPRKPQSNVKKPLWLHLRTGRSTTQTPPRARRARLCRPMVPLAWSPTGWGRQPCIRLSGMPVVAGARSPHSLPTWARCGAQVKSKFEEHWRANCETCPPGEVMGTLHTRMRPGRLESRGGTRNTQGTRHDLPGNVCPNSSVPSFSRTHEATAVSHHPGPCFPARTYNLAAFGQVEIHQK